MPRLAPKWWAVLLMVEAVAVTASPTQAQATGPTPVLVDATVTRNGIPLPAALVPMLRDGDDVHVAFPAYDRRHMTAVGWNMHLDAYYQPTGQQPRFFFQKMDDKSDPEADALYLGKDPKAIDFTYTHATFGLEPLFFLIPDYQQGGDDGGAHSYIAQNGPTLFSGQAAQSTIAVNTSTFLASFVNGLAANAVDLSPSGKNNVLALVASATSNNTLANTAVGDCYNGTGGTATNATAPCIEAALLPFLTMAPPIPGTTQQNNIINNGSLSSTAGALIGQLFPGAQIIGLAVGLLGGIFAKAHGPATPYTYVNGSLYYAYPPRTSAVVGGAQEILVPRSFDFGRFNGQDKQATVVYFGLGNGVTDDTPPKVSVDSANPFGVCATGALVAVPLKLSSAQATVPVTYYHDLQLQPTLPNAAPVSISNDSVSGDVIASRADLEQYRRSAVDLALTGWWGFDKLNTAGQAAHAVVAIPGTALWSVDQGQSTPLIAGASSVTYVLKSYAAPCFAGATLKQGINQLAVASNIQRRSATEVQMTFALNGFTGNLPATLAINEVPDTLHENSTYESDATVAIGNAVPSVPGTTVTHYGDQAILLSGSNVWNYNLVDIVARVNPLEAVNFSRILAPVDATTSTCFLSQNGVGFTAAPVGSVLGGRFFNSATKSDPIASFSILVNPPRPSLGAITIQASKGDFVLPGPLYYNAASALNLETKSGPLAANALYIRLAQSPNPCGALTLAPGTTAGTAIPAGKQLTNTTVRTGGMFASFVPSSVFSDAFSSSLELAVFDPAHQTQSDWTPIPGTFVREPTIDKIDCTRHDGTCDMVGTNLGWIVQVADSIGHHPEGALTGCTSTPANKNCIRVSQHSDGYRFQLVDLPDTWLVDAHLTVRK